MWKKFIIFLVIFTGISILFAQDENFDEQEFFSRLKSSYYTLSSQPILNFTALVTSTKMEAFAKEMWDNEEVFPLQLIWVKPDKIYLSQQGVPKIKENKYKEYQETVNALKLQMKGILFDLQTFYLRGIYDGIQEDYILRHTEEAVQITYRLKDQEPQTNIKYLFGLNGLCLLIEISYPQQNKTLVIEPRFKTVKTKWLCTGWTVKTYIENEIDSGFNLELVQAFVNNLWVPSDIILQVQKSDKAGQNFYDEIAIRNYLFNQPIQLQQSN